jgi:hypothetical protein
MKFLRKLRAIIDIVRTNKFYLITFTDDDEVNWRTEFNINSEEIHDKI